MQPIHNDMKTRFRLLLRAVKEDRVFIVHCPNLETGQGAHLVCEALPIPGTDQVDLLPVAEMIDVFPWDRYGWPGPEELAMTVRLADLRRVQP